MTYQDIILEKHHGVAVLTLNRPDKFNAMSPRMMAEIIAALDETDGDDDARTLEDNGVDIFARVRFEKGVTHLGDELIAERVALLGPVERNDYNLPDHLEQDCLGFVEEPAVVIFHYCFCEGEGGARWSVQPITTRGRRNVRNGTS